MKFSKIEKQLEKQQRSSIIIIILVTFFLVSMYSSGWFGTTQNRLQDSLFSQRIPVDEIIILAIDDKSIQEIGRWPWSRTVFSQLFNKLDNSSVIGVDIGFFEPEDSDVDKLANSLKGKKVVMPIELVFEKELKEPIELLPIPEIRKGVMLGLVNIFSDSDGITRKAPAFYMYNNKTYQSFSSAIYELYNERKFEYKENFILINYVGKPGTFKSYSITDIINNRIDLSELKNKILLLGATSPDLHDTYFTPTSAGKLMPGVEIHANILNTMLTKNFLQKEAGVFVLLTVFLMSAITVIVFKNFKFIFSALFSLLLIVFYIVLAVFCFGRGVVLNIFYPVITVILTYTATSSVFYVTEKRSKKKIEKIFGKYLSKHVANEILSKSSEGELELKGKEKEITVLFTDIRGFTSVSEKMKPKEVVSMLNAYLGEMTKAVFRHDGTVDKYIGDCIMAVFNAPLDQKEHPLLAIKTALDIQKAVKELHEKKRVPKVKVGVGINTGIAVIGNIGSAERMEYTAIGDTVNLASRLCGVAEPEQIIISESTYERAKDKIEVEKLEKIKVKGKEKEIQIYSVKGIKE